MSISCPSVVRRGERMAELHLVRLGGCEGCWESGFRTALGKIAKTRKNLN
jgi:hypothetical protein